MGSFVSSLAEYSGMNALSGAVKAIFDSIAGIANTMSTFVNWAVIIALVAFGLWAFLHLTTYVYGV
jgi:hypothetical protein